MIFEPCTWGIKPDCRLHDSRVEIEMSFDMVIYIYICISTPPWQHFTTAYRVLRNQWIIGMYRIWRRAAWFHLAAVPAGAGILPDSKKFSGQQLFPCFQCFGERCFVQSIRFSRVKTLKELQGPALSSSIYANVLGKNSFLLRTCPFSSNFPAAGIFCSPFWETYQLHSASQFQLFFQRFPVISWAFAVAQDGAAGVISYSLPMDDWKNRCFRSLEILGSTGHRDVLRDVLRIQLRCGKWFISCN